MIKKLDTYINHCIKHNADRIVYELHKCNCLVGIYNSLSDAKSYALLNLYDRFDVFKVVLDNPDDGILKHYMFRMKND